MTNERVDGNRAVVGVPTPAGRRRRARVPPLGGMAALVGIGLHLGMGMSASLTDAPTDRATPAEPARYPDEPPVSTIAPVDPLTGTEPPLPPGGPPTAAAVRTPPTGTPAPPPPVRAATAPVAPTRLAAVDTPTGCLVVICWSAPPANPLADLMWPTDPRPDRHAGDQVGRPGKPGRPPTPHPARPDAPR